MSRNPDKGAESKSALMRIGRNAGWLMGGKGVGALLSLVYLSLAARTLGVDGFGQFILVLTYGQAVANLVQFQSWQTLIRYGAGHAVEGRRHSQIRLIWFSSMLDAAGAATGVLVAVAAVPLAGLLFHWGASEQKEAALFGVSLLFAVRATPTGVLRLFDRFDLATVAETALPLMRLAGALAAVFLQTGITGFLLAWALAELVTSFAMWAVAAVELKHRNLLHLPERGWLNDVAAENPGLWRFAWLTNLGITVNLVRQQIATLAIGGIAAPAMAGGFRLAQQLTQALEKPVASLARAGYPELAHLVSSKSPELTPVIRRSVAFSMSLAAVIVIVAFSLGGPVLELIGGREFLFARSFLVLLSLAVAIDLCAVLLEPLLLALGRAGSVLSARGGAAMIYLAALVVLMNFFGPVGAAVAAIIGSLSTAGFLALALRKNAQLNSVIT